MSNKEFEITGMEIFCWIMFVVYSIFSHTHEGTAKEIVYIGLALFFLMMVKLIQIEERIKKQDKLDNS